MTKKINKSKQKEELVVIVDNNDNIIRSVKRSEMRKKNLMHRGTGVITFNSKGEILIHRRSLNKDKFPGYYDMLNGGAVAYGETYDENAIREVYEEIGVKNPKLEFLFNIKYDKKDNKSFTNVYKQVYDGKIKFQAKEIESGKFVSLAELKKLIKKEKFCPDMLIIFKKYLKEYHEN